MSNVSKSGALANWIDDFISGFVGSNKKEVLAAKDELVEDELVEHVKNFTTISWNGDTYYCDIEDNVGLVYNDFGNIVTTVEGVQSPKEVENILNKNAVVANNDSDDELYANIDSVDEPDLDEIDEQLSKIALSLEDELEENKHEEGFEGDGLAHQERLQYIVANFNSIEEKLNQVENLQKQVSTLEEKLAAVEQLYARNSTLEDVSMYSYEDEEKQISESASQTVDAIKKEHDIDLTTPAGRVEYSNSHNKNDIENVISEDSFTNCQNCNCEECECGTNNNEEVSDSVQKLDGKEEELFKSGICPFTNTQLTKAEVVGDFMGVYSPEGKTEYAVDLNDGSIYFYKG